jgi:hypothetical protein
MDFVKINQRINHNLEASKKFCTNKVLQQYTYRYQFSLLICTLKSTKDRAH